MIDEDDAVDARGLVRQGMGIRNTVLLADAAPDNDYLAHRVGYRITDAQRDDAAPDQRTLAHQEMCRTISDAWKHPPAQPASDAQMAHNATNPQRRVALMADANDREAAYQEYLTWLQDAWRETSA